MWSIVMLSSEHYEHHEAAGLQDCRTHRRQRDTRKRHTETDRKRQETENWKKDNEESGRDEEAVRDKARETECGYLLAPPPEVITRGAMDRKRQNGRLFPPR